MWDRFVYLHPYEEYKKVNSKETTEKKFCTIAFHNFNSLTFIRNFSFMSCPLGVTFCGIAGT